MLDVDAILRFAEQIKFIDHLPWLSAGVAIALAITYFWMSRSRRAYEADYHQLGTEMEKIKESLVVSNRDNASLDQRLDDLLVQLKSKTEKVTDLSNECERLHEEWVKLKEKHKRLHLRNSKNEETASALNRQLEQISASDGKLWSRKPDASVEPFRPLSLRRTPIVSVLNLKGGVGKTTITANLGLGLSQLGYRVLMIDLDHQGSLSSLLLTGQELADVRTSRRFIEDVFRHPNEAAESLARCTVRLSAIPAGESFLVAADEQLADVETQLMARWMTTAPDGDVRYILRKALHSVTISDQYDVILLDCPPRLTTACINALTASDFVISPVLLDTRSAEAVPRLLSWLKTLRPEICPELSFLGVVGNKAFPRIKLIAREQSLWDDLNEKCRDAWGQPVRQFKTIVRDHPKLDNPFAALDSKHQARYLDLANELRKELRLHESVKLSDVSSGAATRS